MKLEPNPNDPRTFVWSLIVGEILTRRNDVGPLARPWAAKRIKRRSPKEVGIKDAKGQTLKES